MTIKELREKTNLTQKEFAEKYHFTLRQVQTWEQGYRETPECILYLLEQVIERRIEMLGKKQMKLIIDIDEEDYKYIKNSNDMNFNAIKNGIPLEEKTNGEVIKTLFPDNKYVEGEKFVIIQGETENISLWNKWWYAPYKENKQ